MRKQWRDWPKTLLKEGAELRGWTGNHEALARGCCGKPKGPSAWDLMPLLLP